MSSTGSMSTTPLFLVQNADGMFTSSSRSAITRSMTPQPEQTSNPWGDRGSFLTQSNKTGFLAVPQKSKLPSARNNGSGIASGTASWQTLDRGRQSNPAASRSSFDDKSTRAHSAPPGSDWSQWEVTMDCTPVSDFSVGSGGAALPFGWSTSNQFKGFEAPTSYSDQRYDGSHAQSQTDRSMFPDCHIGYVRRWDHPADRVGMPFETRGRQLADARKAASARGDSAQRALTAFIWALPVESVAAPTAGSEESEAAVPFSALVELIPPE